MTPNTPVSVRKPQLLRAKPSEIKLGIQRDKARANVDVRLVIVDEHATTLDSEMSASESAKTVFV